MNLNTETRTFLVTGATGMLGARIVFDLLKQGDRVKAIYRQSKRIDQFKKNIGFYCQNPGELTNLVEWIEADVLDYQSLCDALEGVDMVIHSAAMVSFHRDDEKAMLEININGTANLVNACLFKGVKNICHISSIAALGKEENGAMIDEESTWIPEQKHSAYAISKFHSEMEIWRGINEGLNAVIVNPSVILGPGEWKAGGSPAFFNNLYKGMAFYPEGGTGFVDVRDVSLAILTLISPENFQAAMHKRFLINAENLSYQKAFTLIAESLQVQAPKLLARKYLLGIAWRAAWLAGKLTGKKPMITRESVSNASKMQLFNGGRIVSEFAFRYRPIGETISNIGQMYLADCAKK
ncbi:MAG: SDR family NAD(P)-dependent oxidoreductase [Prolixibacteraceae bacterium]|nr:SDR family NAD(P)-dependent oxidoreductase [Prolixibacteraceae bacterium]